LKAVGIKVAADRLCNGLLFQEGGAGGSPYAAAADRAVFLKNVVFNCRLWGRIDFAAAFRHQKNCASALWRRCNLPTVVRPLFYKDGNAGILIMEVAFCQTVRENLPGYVMTVAEVEEALAIAEKRNPAALVDIAERSV
jgi:hypothetical protein